MIYVFESVYHTTSTWLVLDYLVWGTFDEEKYINYKNRFTFYFIGEINHRKGVGDTIQAFCETFSEKDQVQLILKIHNKGYSNENKLNCKFEMAKLIKSHTAKAPIICLTENLTENNIVALHSLGDCYVALVKSEGFGLPIFDAFNYGKTVIATGHGGQVDFLKGPRARLVEYSLGPVTGMNSMYYEEDQIWAYPDIQHAKRLMREVYEEAKDKYGIRSI